MRLGFLGQLWPLLVDNQLLRQRLKLVQRQVVLLIVAAILALLAVVFFLAAIMAGLASFMPAWLAALLVSLVLLGIAGGLVALVRHRWRHIEAPVESRSNSSWIVPLLGPSLELAREKPGEALLVAVAAGIVADSLLSRRRK